MSKLPICKKCKQESNNIRFVKIVISKYENYKFNLCLGCRQKVIKFMKGENNE